jgi:hypothetical protein
LFLEGGIKGRKAVKSAFISDFRYFDMIVTRGTQFRFCEIDAIRIDEIGEIGIMPFIDNMRGQIRGQSDLPGQFLQGKFRV